MKYPSPPTQSIPSSSSPQLSDNNYSLFMFHVFYISSFRWQCNDAFLHKTHKVYPSVVWRLNLLSEYLLYQTIEELRGPAIERGEVEWLQTAVSAAKVECVSLVTNICISHRLHSYCRKINTGIAKSNICHFQLIGLWCTAGLMTQAVMYAGLCLCTVTSTQPAYNPAVGSA